MFTEMRVLQQSTGDDHLVWNPVLVIVDLFNDIFFLVMIHLFPSIENLKIYEMQVLELGMNFRTADDMGAVLAAKLTKKLGFGMWARLHLTGMHVEGKVTSMFLFLV